MKQALSIIAALSALAVGQAHAQGTSFEGFSLAMNLESEGASTSATDGTSDSGRSTGVAFQAKYDWALGNQFVLGLGASANTENRLAGTYMSGASSYSSKRYSLDIEPGYAINNALLVFGKASSISATVASDDGASNTSAQGLGYGVGLRGMIDHNAFWQAGIDTYKLNDASFSTGTTASLKGNVVSLGIGYKF